MGLHLYEWSSGNWLFSNNDTSSLSECLVDWSNAVIWGLDLTKEDWLLESWCRDKLTSVEDSSGGWDDLTTSSVDSIGMKGDIMDIESASSHVLITENTFLGSPLESSLKGILDFVQELDSLSNINEAVWSVVVWSIAPNLGGIGLDRGMGVCCPDYVFEVLRSEEGGAGPADARAGVDRRWSRGDLGARRAAGAGGLRINVEFVR